MRRHHLAVAAATLLTACTCREPPEITGQVVDWWGHEVDGAEVKVKDLEGPPIFSDAKGEFRLPMKDTWNITVTRAGILPRTTDVIPMSVDEPHRETVEVVPVPPGPGFHVVGTEAYRTLPGQPVERIGDDVKVYQGVREIGDVVVDQEPLKVVFHAPLKLGEGASADVELHRLDKVEKADLVVDGVPTPTDVNLWVSAGTVDFEKVPLGGDESWAFRADDLVDGTYAFVHSGLMLPKTEKEFAKIAPAVRMAYVFTIKK